MKQQRIYIDTSIVGGFFDIEFENDTKMLFQRLENKEIIFVISELLREELKSAPERVRNLLDNYSDDSFETVTLTDEAKELADKYIAESVIGRTSLDDCRHIALATINKVDVLASWNFKHIVNLVRIRGYNGVNLKNGYTTIEIRNPKDLVDYGKEF
jgi:predicted nucleic acid-binding protein